MRYAIFSCVLLAGCTSLPPMSPEERAAFLQSMQRQQIINQQSQQNMLDAYSRRPTIPAPPQPIHCTSTTNMGVTNTSCY